MDDIGDFLSPNELMSAAKAQMLGGRDPVNKKDYSLIINFIAHNLMPDIALSACLLMRITYEMPISAETVTEIVEFQLSKQDETELENASILYNHRRQSCR